MRVIRASAMGVCFGVRDALKVADTVAQPVQVTVYGELVHNPLVQQRMRRRGFQQFGEGEHRDAIPDTPHVLITAHGISQRRAATLRDAGKTLLDTTCPLVKKAHAAAIGLRDQGYHVLLIGRPGHVEVQGITEDLYSYDVLPDSAAVKTYHHHKLGIICQTTTPSARALEIRAAVKRKNPHAEIKYIDTICQPTKDRQLAVEDLLNQVNTVVVVGGKNSNNTRQLVHRCQDRGAVVYHVQSPEELDSRWFDGVDVVGLTAGTSTLPETIESVYRALGDMESTSGVVGNNDRWLNYSQKTAARSFI
ncbi:MAG: 4-hydroxy-3-methylbut-2-enyl diphosphate reductase [Phycisphaerae bacterium]